MTKESSTINLEITGMSCAHCVTAVRRALESVDGVTVEDVSIGLARVSSGGDSEVEAHLRSALEEEGYSVAEVSSAA